MGGAPHPNTRAAALGPPPPAAPRQRGRRWVARDGLVLGELPPGAKVGTSAPWRASQLRALGLGLDIVALRGVTATRAAGAATPNSSPGLAAWAAPHTCSA